MKEFYPGSKQEVRSFSEPESEEEPFYLTNPVIKNWGGAPAEFYLTGQLAAALNRKAGTLRLWERNGTIPKPTFTVRSGNRYAKRRLYTAEQINGLRRIAIEEGILSDTARHISKTNFAKKAEQLFKELNS